jgi:osmoprotectant transport system permease protein
MTAPAQAMTPRGGPATARFSVRIPNERIFYALLGLVGLMIAWQLASNAGIIKKILMSSPIDIARVAVQDFTTGAIWPHITISLQEWILGFLIAIAVLTRPRPLRVLGLLGTAIALPLGLYLGHHGKGEFAAINTSNVGRAVPTLVLLTVFIAYVGVGFVPIMISLALLALPPVLTNTWVAVRQVERDSVDAARGMGMTHAEIIRKVELPLSLPTIFAGIRVAAVNVVATATIAPLGSVDSLGTPIISGNVYGADGRLGAAIAVSILTLLVSALLAQVQKAVTPEGLKLGADRTRRRRLLPKLRRRETATP